MDPQKIIISIKERILAEQRKHPDIDWPLIAANKIYNAHFKDSHSIGVPYHLISDSFKESMRSIDDALNKKKVERSAKANKELTNGNSTYWVVESKHDNQIVYWTGNIPHLSVQQAESGYIMWTPDIHKAQKMDSKDDAEQQNEEFAIYGEVTEHMDVER